MILLDEEGMLEYFEAEVPEEMRNHELFNLITNDFITELLMAGKAQAKKILIKLQAIYAEIGMYDEKMKEFIKELEEEVK